MGLLDHFLHLVAGMGCGKGLVPQRARGQSTEGERAAGAEGTGGAGVLASECDCNMR